MTTSAWTWPKRILATAALILVALAGGCCLFLIKNAEPVNPLRAMTRETDFIRSGYKMDHIRVSEDKTVGSGRLIKGIDQFVQHLTCA